MSDWNGFRDEIKQCKKCEMAKTKKNVVIGRGSAAPIVVFVGEAPGETEDARGIPFCGRAGQVLDAEIHRIGLCYNDYYVLNAVKCRPITADFRNIKPTIVEIENCSGFLRTQIELLKPKIIVMLGNSAEEAFGVCLRVHGEPFSEIQFMKFIHPAATLYKPKMYLVLRVQFDNLRKKMEDFTYGRECDRLF